MEPLLSYLRILFRKLERIVQAVGTPQKPITGISFTTMSFFPRPPGPGPYSPEKKVLFVPPTKVKKGTTHRQDLPSAPQVAKPVEQIITVAATYPELAEQAVRDDRSLKGKVTLAHHQGPIWGRGLAAVALRLWVEGAHEWSDRCLRRFHNLQECIKHEEERIKRKSALDVCLQFLARCLIREGIGHTRRQFR